MPKRFSLVSLSALAGLMLAAASAAQEAPLNPHLREGCLHCHRTDPGIPSAGTRIITPEGADSHAVIADACRTCHKEGKQNFWILMLPPGTAPPAGAVPLAPAAAPIPASPPPGAAGEGFSNTHDSMECTKCHEKHPGSIKGRLTEAFPFGSGGEGGFCRGCHDRVDQTHFPRGNRPRPSVKCLTCHQAHGSTLLYPDLREDYPVFLIESRDINPHGGKIFCLSCHKDSPQGGQAVNFRSPGNATAMCQRCHTGIEHHVLGVKSSPGTWKMDFSDFPLENEKLTCVTCHDPYECDGVVTKENPRFLRGGPYNTVEEFCARCHEGRTLATMNPHDQIDDEGNPRRKQCLYCHVTAPEEGFELGPADFTDDLQSLCASCHPTGPHPDVNHLVEVPPEMAESIHQYEERRLVILPLAEGRFITCVTCHNPHERGLLRGPAGAGADEEKRLRLATFNEICTPCHGRH